MKLAHLFAVPALALGLAALPAVAQAGCEDTVASSAAEAERNQRLSSSSLQSLEAACGSDGVSRVVWRMVRNGTCAQAAQFGRSLSTHPNVTSAIDEADSCLAEQVATSLDDLERTATYAPEPDANHDPMAAVDVDEAWGPFAEAGDSSGLAGAESRSGGLLGDLGTGYGGGGLGKSGARGKSSGYGRSADAASAPASQPRRSRRAATGMVESEEFSDELAAVASSAYGGAAPRDMAYSKLSLGIWFDYDSSSLRPEALETLAALSRRLRTMEGGTVLEIVGHTDSTGTWYYNADLSVRRARSVQRALTLAGVATSNTAVRGAGEDEPAYTNSTYWGRAQNRRVEFRFLRPMATRPVTR